MKCMNEFSLFWLQRGGQVNLYINRVSVASAPWHAEPRLIVLPFVLFSRRRARYFRFAIFNSSSLFVNCKVSLRCI